MREEGKFKRGERVKVYTKNRKDYLLGTVVNYNNFREPGMEYAIDVRFSDYLFVGENQLEKIEEEK